MTSFHVFGLYKFDGLWTVQSLIEMNPEEGVWMDSKKIMRNAGA